MLAVATATRCVMAMLCLFVLARYVVQGLGGTIASIVNAIQIQVMNAVYSTMARKLNDWGKLGVR